MKGRKVFILPGGVVASRRCVFSSFPSFSLFVSPLSFRSVVVIVSRWLVPLLDNVDYWNVDVGRPQHPLPGFYPNFIRPFYKNFFHQQVSTRSNCKISFRIHISSGSRISEAVSRFKLKVYHNRFWGIPESEVSCKEMDQLLPSFRGCQCF